MADTASKMPQIFAICTIVGALLLIIAAFLGWIDFDQVSKLADTKTTDTLNGMDMYDHDFGDYDNVAKYSALVGLILGIVVIILAALNFIGKLSQVTKYTDLINAIVAIVAIIFMILTLTWDVFDQSIDLGALYTAEYNLGTGVYVALVGAILSFVGSIIPFVLKMIGKA